MHNISICKTTGSYNVSYYGNCILRVTDVVRVYGKIYFDLTDEELYEKLQKAGAEVLLDDRDERPGVKFKDADLIGLPIRIVVGKRAAENCVEYVLRRDGNRLDITADEAYEKAVALIREEIHG